MKRLNLKQSQSCVTDASCEAAAQSRIKYREDTAPQCEKQEKYKPKAMISHLWREAEYKA